MATLAHGGLDKSVVHFAVSAKKDMLARLVQNTAKMKLPAAPNTSLDRSADIVFATCFGAARLTVTAAPANSDVMRLISM